VSVRSVAGSEEASVAAEGLAAALAVSVASVVAAAAEAAPAVPGSALTPELACISDRGNVGSS
jgi:hypothetical protein